MNIKCIECDGTSGDHYLVVGVNRATGHVFKPWHPFHGEVGADQARSHAAGLEEHGFFATVVGLR